MSYFADIPNVYYDFNILGTNKMFILKDLTFNIRFQSDILSQVTIYDEYDIHDGETPEILSERIYGTPYYHWTIMLANNIFDYIHDWPMSSLQFQSYVDDKYTHALLNSTHHYINSDGFILNSTESYIDPYATNHVVVCELTIGSNIITATSLTGFNPLFDGNQNMQIAGIGIDMATIAKVVNIDNPFTMRMSGAATQSGQTTLTFIHIKDPLIGATAVTNLEYETQLNDAKRRIKLLHPSVLPSLIEQVKVLTSNV
jgi:hypothetical protein